MPAGVRVGIVSWNTAELLDRCLAALPEALDGTKAWIVVVDNASDDGSADVACSHPGVEVIRNSANVGYAKAINQALTHNAEEVVPSALIALNPDTVAPPKSLRMLVERLLEDPSVGLVAPRLENPDGTAQHSVYRFPSPTVSAMASFVPLRWQRKLIGPDWWLETASEPDRRCDIDWAIGGVHVLRPESVNTSQPYSERWFMYAEDLDLCWRMAQAGWRRRLEGDVVVVHKGNAAGSQAWGPLRTERWLTATYEWYQSTRGRMAVRVWALINLAGAGVRLTGSLFRHLHGRPTQDWERDVRRSLPIHARVLVPARP
ncbi:MAG TPA: glycosyltransferase family 2 protein [Acidimicrobiales bacterium]|nr:glycosyltransferase family 2 protein [Acidimicrobiales bacterium]